MHLLDWSRTPPADAFRGRSGPARLASRPPGPIWCDVAGSAAQQPVSAPIAWAVAVDSCASGGEKHRQDGGIGMADRIYADAAHH